MTPDEIEEERIRARLEGMPNVVVKGVTIDRRRGTATIIIDEKVFFVRTDATDALGALIATNFYSENSAGESSERPSPKGGE